MTRNPAFLVLARGLVIIAATFWVFSPALHGGWLWDDGTLIRQNSLIHDPAGLWRIWFEPVRLVEYLPLTVSLEWMEWHLWGSDTQGYHLVSIGLHLLSAFLVWRLLGKFNLRFAWLGGLLFAIHPVVVESVAWISELKNTLSLPPFLLALCAWIDYSRKEKTSDYLRALGLFIVAMFCKTSVMMFPVLILLYAWWRRNRIEWSDVRASLPFFAVSLLLGFLQISLQHHNGEIATAHAGLIYRLDSIGWALLFFFVRCLFPVGLLPLYPSGLIVSFSTVDLLPWLLFSGLLGIVWFRRSSWGRHALLGIGFFMLNLVPVLGFILMKATSMVWSLDHLAYISLIGLIGLVVAGYGELSERLSPALRPLVLGTVSLLTVALAAISHHYAGVFANSETLWTYTLKKNPSSEIAHNNLGLVYLNSNRLPQAIEQFEASLKLRPDYAIAYNGLGNALVLSNRTEEAIADYREALRINPNYPEAHNGLANIFLQTGQLSDAQAESEKSLHLKPDYFEAHCTLGLILAQQGRTPEAIAQFETASRLNPSDPRVPKIIESLRAAPPASPGQK